MIFRGFASLDQCLDVAYRYSQIKKAALAVTSGTFPPIFKALANAQSTAEGISIHADVTKMGFDSYTSTCNSIISFYSKCGMMDSGFSIFDGMKNRDSVSWNAVIHGFMSQEDFESGLSFFVRAQMCNFVPNISTLILAIQACWRSKAVASGRNIHGFVIKSGFSAVSSVQNALLSFCVKSQELESAQKLFDEMFERDVISWSALISGYAQCGDATDALLLFRSMYEEGIRMDGLAAVSILQACTNAGDLDNGKSMHGQVIREGFEDDVFVANSLVDMYSKCLDVDSALLVFSQMPSTNAVSWNSIISGLIHNERDLEALVMFDSMRKVGVKVDEFTIVNLLHACKRLELGSFCKCIHGVVIRRSFLNDFVSNSLLDAYAKCSLVEHALKLFDSMGRRDVISWSTMIAGFARAGKPDEAITLFKEMQLAEEIPNSVTMLSLLEACAVSAELKLSRTAHCFVLRKHLVHDLAVGTALVDMYAKCGDLNSSKKVFDELPTKSVLTWNAMIGALGMNGRAKEALGLLREMELRNVKPNGVTMLSILSACSHGGLLEDGVSCFNKMLKDPSIQPTLEHYSCMVDMLARAGDLDGALEMIKRIPQGLEAGPAAWGSLLSACRSYGNFELGKCAASKVIELEPENSAGYLLSSSVLAKRGLTDNIASVRWSMKQRRLKMVSGYSLVHVEQRACKFVAWDESHPRSEEIYSMVECVHDCMKVLKERN